MTGKKRTILEQTYHGNRNLKKAAFKDPDDVLREVRSHGEPEGTDVGLDTTGDLPDSKLTGDLDKANPR